MREYVDLKGRDNRRFEKMMQQGISSWYPPDVIGTVKSRGRKGVGHYLAWERREDKMMNKKFPSENMKAREYFGRLRRW
jgi:hypothetical protein